MDETKDYINTDSEKKIELNEKVDLVEEEKKIDDNLMFEKKAYLFLNYIAIYVVL